MHISKVPIAGIGIDDLFVVYSKQLNGIVRILAQFLRNT